MEVASKKQAPATHFISVKEFVLAVAVIDLSIMSY